jgi:hypothetical protein
MPVNPLINLIQQQRLIIQFIANLNREIVLPCDGFAELA